MNFEGIKNTKPFIGDLTDSDLLKLIISYPKDQIHILVDENTSAILPLLKVKIPEITGIKEIIISSGEKNKNIDTVIDIWTFLSSKNITRNSLLINLGGGVITDMGGFIASTYKRGIDFINIPTTLLAMVDASVGGKTGIDLDNFKNQVGLFAQPKGIYCDVVFLNSLPQTELISGFAEVLKHGLVKDKSYWNHCTKTDFNSINWKDVISKSIDIKIEIVNNDPSEQGERKLLNFGHTIGHGIETFMMNQSTPILHGEAVAIGMICESYLSVQSATLSKEDLKEITEQILTIFSKIDINKSSFDTLIELMKNDKKNISNEINFSLLNAIGNGIFNQSCSEDLIKESLEYYIAL